MRLVVGHDGTQVFLAENQHAVQELAAQCADQALADRVHPRRLDRGAQDDGAGGLEDGIERGGEFEPRSRIRNLMAPNRSSRVGPGCGTAAQSTPRWDGR
jgi:hypothetical protein